ncbi:MAG: hypothetical protein NO515_06075 [Candidatus Methanomethylicia archaeon]|jgi:hypothetical protein|nr:hypothetical protein [Candidatus Methanomethylicia archaeon]
MNAYTCKEYVYLYLPKELSDWLKQEAMRERRSLNNYISIILEDYYRQRREGIKCTSRQS